MFRSALIEALGDYHADHAVASLIETAQMDGPLQVDAAIALGKIGDRRALNALVAAQRAQQGRRWRQSWRASHTQSCLTSLSGSCRCAAWSRGNGIG